MLRFICFLFGKTYEPCKGCEVLKQQLVIANENNKQHEELFLSLLQPKVVEQPAAREVPALNKPLNTFTKRREVLEAEDRNKAKALESTFIVKPDDINRMTDHKHTAGNPGSVEKLEQELGIENAS